MYGNVSGKFPISKWLLILRCQARLQRLRVSLPAPELLRCHAMALERLQATGRNAGNAVDFHHMKHSKPSSGMA